MRRFVLVAIALFTFAANAAPVGKAPAAPTLIPQLTIVQRDHYTSKSGDKYIVYRIGVTNLDAFPAKLFVRDEKLPPNPCRTHGGVRLLWSINTAEGQRLSCGEVVGRDAFRASVRQLEGSPRPVRLTLIDSQSSTEYTSAILDLAAK